MIGIFDSWSGGLTFLAAMYTKFPEYSYVYFGDYNNCPYGSKSPEEIQSLTISWVQKLFDAGANIVIIACNTASAWTLRKMQTEIFPQKKILWVTIPWAERVVELGLRSVTVFATQQTVNSRTYRERMGILDESIYIEEIALPWSLVQNIEWLLPVQRCHSEKQFQDLLSLYQNNEWECMDSAWIELTQQYFSSYTPQESILLGCTHYPYLTKSLKILFPNIPIIDPSEESAKKLQQYIIQHNVNIRHAKELLFL